MDDASPDPAQAETNSVPHQLQSDSGQQGIRMIILG
jgi:hypothetical protein